jgi:hypothetical protein
MISTTFSRVSIDVANIAMAIFFVPSSAPRAKDYIKEDRPQQRGYSESVMSEGGRTVWVQEKQPAAIRRAGPPDMQESRSHSRREQERSSRTWFK